jgi:glycosyltransferase involved in cell wall biosynthesis
MRPHPLLETPGLLSRQKSLRILGTRGIPAAHGGFETFAERLALYLVQRGWRVVVYCQEHGDGPIVEDTWQGIQRVRIPVRQPDPIGTVVFDWRSIAHAVRHDDLCLTLGYNTAVFCARLRINGVRNLINMDGVEWKRSKWSRSAKAWFYLNDWFGCWIGNHLIADNPEIKSLLSSRVRSSKISMIPYGADELVQLSSAPLSRFGVEPGGYLTLIARPEPENSILPLVSAFSRRRREMKLVVLGDLDDRVPYHAAVKAAASDQVVFAGAIYDREIVQALRFYCSAYLHGHRVGGTNPSLVEAMGAGNAVIAFDSPFNRWVAGNAALYFLSEDEADEHITQLIVDPQRRARIAQAIGLRFAEQFSWHGALAQYEELLERWIPDSPRALPAALADPRVGTESISLAPERRDRLP